MRLVMMGTGPFAVPTFEALYGTSHEVAALFTRPDRTARGRGKIVAGPMRAVAQRHGTPVFDPESVNTDEARRDLAGLEPDLLVVCDYGQILAPETLAVARRGGINLHASLLPKYRGAAPINWAIYNGETETGVTVIHMTPRVDAGPCIAQAAVEIGDDETAPQLEERLARLGAPLVCDAIDRLLSGEVRPLPQDPAVATRAPRLKKQDGAIGWHRSAEQIQNQVRAMQPWPKTYTYWHRRDGGEPLRLIVQRAAVAERPLPRDAAGGTVGAAETATPGTVVAAGDAGLVVATGDGWLSLEEVQPSGKRAMSADEFLRGHRLEPGDRLADE